MTVKDIAELCGVEAKTVYRWTEKAESLNDKMSLRKKIDAGSPETPADFTLEETLAIIDKGGGHTTLAALLEDNAKNKNALAAYNPVGNLLGGPLDRLIEAKIAEALANTRPALARGTPKNTRSFNDITKAISAMKKWNGRWYPVTQDEFDGVLKLLVLVKNHLMEGA